MSPLIRNSLAAAAILTAVGCDSERVKTFKGHSSAMCECSDADCAKAEHTKFVGSWNGLQTETIDWASAEGKKDKKGIEDATKSYRECLDKHVPAKDATSTCQDDADAKKSSDACTTCCNREGRFFKTWVDPLAAGLAGALGGGDIKGCTCS